MLRSRTRDPDSASAEARRRRRLHFVMIGGTASLLGLVVLGPYVEFAAYLSWLHLQFVATGLPTPIAMAAALLLTGLLAQSVRLFLAATWRGQPIRQFASLLLPAILIIAGYALSRPQRETWLPSIRYEAPNLILNSQRFGVITIPLRSSAQPEPLGLSTQPESAAAANSTPADERPREAQRDLLFKLGSCTMTTDAGMECALTVTNTAPHDAWVMLWIGDKSGAQTEMFDEDGREYVALMARLGNTSWQRYNRYEKVQVVPQIPTKGSIHFGLVQDIERISVLRVTFIADGNVERIEFRNVPIHRAPPLDEPPASIGAPVRGADAVRGSPDTGSEIALAVSVKNESRTPDTWNDDAALGVLRAKREELLRAIKALKLSDADANEYVASVGEWAAQMEEMVAELASARLSESEWHAFIVRLTDQADAMVRAPKAPRGGIHIQWRRP